MRNPKPAKASPTYYFECGRCHQPQPVEPDQANGRLPCSCGVTNIVPSIIHLRKIELENCPAFAPAPAGPRGATPHCPFCSHPMQSGRIIGDRYRLKWLDTSTPLAMGIWALGGTPIGHGGFMQFNRPHVWGWRCATCAKIIVDERA